MGRRGPVPKPESLKLLHGNPGKRPLNARTALTTAARATCPEWLSSEAKAEWHCLAPELERMGLLTALDRTAFAAYCESYADWVACRRFVREHGEYYLAPGGRLRTWPQVEMAKKAEQSMRAFASEFGLTPNARARLSIEPQTKDEDDEFEKFLRRAK